MTSIQNLGLFAFPIIAGKITDVANKGITNEMLTAGTATLDYTYTIIMFAGLGLVGFLFAYLLKREDKRNTKFGLEKAEMEEWLNKIDEIVSFQHAHKKR